MKKLFVLILLGGIISYNLYPQTLSPFEKVKNEVLERQDNVNAKVDLAKMYLENNDWRNAQEILEKTRNANIEIRNKIEFQKNEPERIRNEINKWEKIVHDYPNFRDGFLKLATLNWQLYNNDMAKWYWQKAFELDPNGLKTELVGQHLGLVQ